MTPVNNPEMVTILNAFNCLFFVHILRSVHMLHCRKGMSGSKSHMSPICKSSIPYSLGSSKCMENRILMMQKFQFLRLWLRVQISAYTPLYVL